MKQIQTVRLVQAKDGKTFVVSCLYCGILGYHVSPRNVGELAMSHTLQHEAAGSFCTAASA